MNKSLLSAVCFIALSCACFAQDVIATKDSTNIEPKLKEMNEDSVKVNAIPFESIIMQKRAAQNAGSVSSVAKTSFGPGGEIQISTAAELAAINYSSTSKRSYMLMNDLTVENWTPIGSQIRPFLGTFDGNGYTITIMSFRIQAPLSYNDYTTVSIGLFGVTGEGSIIENLRVAGNLTYDAEALTLYMGAIAGENGGVIRRCISTANIDARGGRYKTGKAFGQILASGIATGGGGTAYQNEVCGGGITGLNKKIIKNCYTTGQITVSGEGFKNAGGIVGKNGFGDLNRGTISKCYATGNILAKEDVAARIACGIAAACIPGEIINCVALNERVEAIGKSKGAAVGSLGLYLANNVRGITATVYNPQYNRINAFYRSDMLMYMEKDEKNNSENTDRKNHYGKEIAYYIMQSQTWWTDEKSGVVFSFGSNQYAPWIWNDDLKRPVLFWETPEGRESLDSLRTFQLFKGTFTSMDGKTKIMFEGDQFRILAPLKKGKGNSEHEGTFSHDEEKIILTVKKLNGTEIRIFAEELYFKLSQDIFVLSPKYRSKLPPTINGQYSKK